MAEIQIDLIAIKLNNQILKNSESINYKKAQQEKDLLKNQNQEDLDQLNLMSAIKTKINTIFTDLNSSNVEIGADEKVGGIKRVWFKFFNMNDLFELIITKNQSDEYNCYFSENDVTTPLNNNDFKEIISNFSYLFGLGIYSERQKNIIMDMYY